MRYVTAFGYELPFTYFHDDDMLPGSKTLEHFLRHAEELPDFGLLGQAGRFSPDGRYCPASVSQSSAFRAVDSVVRGYFVRSMHLHHILRLKWQLKWEGKMEDDLLAAGAMRLYGNLPILLTPKVLEPAEKMNMQELPSPYALCSRPDHLYRRTAFVQTLRSLGWQAVSDGAIAQRVSPSAEK